MARSLHILPIACALAALSACGVHSQPDAPALTGPSTNAKTLTVQVTPDVLTQDGQSQSVVSIKSFGPNGQPLPAVSLRAEIMVGGAVTDFGALSARNLATDGSGSATVIYTAPAPVFGAAGAIVAVRISPIDDKDAANTNPVLATIRLVPPGIIGPPTSSLVPDFTVPTPTVGNPTTFVATITGTGADPVALLWDFGDGTTGGSLTTTHTYQSIGTYLVTLRILDSLGRTNSATHAVTVTQGDLPTASFTVSPTPPQLHQAVNFNASASTAEPGHNIVSYAWNFGDGSFGSGQLVSHVFDTANSYVVSLQVTDDVGRKSTVATQTVSVGTNGPTASFTTSPSSPTIGQTINLDASQSSAAAGRTIVSYAWTFGDGTSGSGVRTTHAYAANGAYSVTLTVTDSAGQTGFSTQTISVGTTLPTAAFSFSPTSPAAGQTINFNGLASTAPAGRTITVYNWNFGDGGTAVGAQPTHVFAVAGTYAVTLTVTDSASQNSTPASQSVTVGASLAPTAVISFSPSSPVVGQTVNFNGSGSTAPSGRTVTAWAWNFGDGATGAGATPTHAYTTTGTFTVTLVVTDNTGQPSAPVTTTVGVSNAAAPTASFFFLPGSPVVGQTVVFNASASTAGTGRTIVTYAWDFGDGTTGTGVSTTHTYTTAGSYSASLTVTDNGSPALSGSTSQNVNVTDGTVVITITSGTSGTTGTNVTVSFDSAGTTAAPGRSIVSYAWTFSNGAPPAVGSTASHDFMATNPGANTYSATLTITDNVGHTTTTTKTFTVTGT